VVDVAIGRHVRVPERIPLVDCGDMVVYPYDLDRTSQLLRETMRLLSERGAFPIVLGGDHYITYPRWRDLARRSSPAEADASDTFTSTDTWMPWTITSSAGSMARLADPAHR
jgi:hypothetical protein